MDKSHFWRNAVLLVIMVIMAFIPEEHIDPTNAPIPVCHAKTEDSDIVDCDYHDGAWWTK